MHMGTIIKISRCGELFVVEYPCTAKRREYSVFMFRQPSDKVALKVGDLVQGRLDFLHRQELKRTPDGVLLKVFGHLCAESYQRVMQLF